jgi:hypothetical protein
MFHFQVAVGWELLGPDYLDGDFGDEFLMTGCFARTSIEAGGPEDGRRFDEVRLGGCCIPKLTVVVWSFLGPHYSIGTGILGTGFHDGLLCTPPSLKELGGGWREIRRPWTKAILDPGGFLEPGFL